MNDFAITPRRLMSLKLPGLQFMYPGDVWDSEVRTFDTEGAIARYSHDMRQIKIEPTPPPVPVKTVQAAVDRMLVTLRRRFTPTLMRRLQPFEIYLHDCDKVLRVVPGEGCSYVLNSTPETREQARYVMCSQVAWYTFSYTWGWGALDVSGMFLDREYAAKGEHRIAFYLNLLGTELLSVQSCRQVLRTTEFFWKKRREIVSRLSTRWGTRRDDKAVYPTEQNMEEFPDQNRAVVG
jgi:hypothetical protein